MTAQQAPATPVRVPFLTNPTQAHRVAADRAMRLAHEHGLVEVVEFFDELSPWERPIVFALLARKAGARTRRPVLPVDADPVWWTEDEQERVHALYMGGNRSPWVQQGQALWSRARKSAARRAERVAKLL